MIYLDIKILDLILCYPKVYPLFWDPAESLLNLKYYDPESLFSNTGEL